MKKMYMVLIALFFVVSANAQINFGGTLGYAKLVPFLGCYITEVNIPDQVMVEVAPGVTYALRASWFPGEGTVPSGCTVAEACERLVKNQMQNRARRAGVEIQGTDSGTLGGYVFGAISASKAKKAAQKAAAKKAAEQKRRAAAAAPTTNRTLSSSAAKAPIKAKYELNLNTGKISKIDPDYDF